MLCHYCEKQAWYTGHLIGCRKKSKITREFSGICAEKYGDYVKNRLDYTLFHSYLNSLVRFLHLCLFKFILTISLNRKMILWDDEQAKKTMCSSFLAQVVVKRSFLSITLLFAEMSMLFIQYNKTSTCRLIAKRRMKCLEVKIACEWGGMFSLLFRRKTASK